MPAALSVLAYALQFASALPQLIAAGQSIRDLVTSSTTAMQTMVAEDRGPSAAEWEALNTVTNALRAQLHKP